MDAADKIKQRLEYLRGELRAERISYEELFELQGLANEIEPGDMKLLEAAGVPEELARKWSKKVARKYEQSQKSR